MINNDFTSDDSSLSSDGSSEQTIKKSLLNLAVQNYRYNAFMERPSSSSHSFFKDLHKKRISSNVFKLVEAINLNILSSIPFKGKKPFWGIVTPEIEKLSTENLDTLVLELSDNVSQSETMTKLVDNIYTFLRIKAVKSSFEEFLLDGKEVVLFPVDAIDILNDLNLFPNNIKTLFTRTRLLRSIQLEEPTTIVNKIDVPVITKFYSFYMEYLSKLIMMDLNTIKLENLMNNSFNSVQKILKKSSSLKKRTLEKSADIPIEKNSKILNGYNK